MYQITTLSKNNYSINVPNTFFRQETETNQLTMIFPGLNYSCDMPLLYYAAQIMLEALLKAFHHLLYRCNTKD
ncbi:MAG: hypothetical protein Q7U53_01620 [Anaerolineaceae bacterium]|nr:hypothetical protein [Anaerolineaceae bacterium]